MLFMDWYGNMYVIDSINDVYDAGGSACETREFSMLVDSLGELDDEAIASLARAIGLFRM